MYNRPNQTISHLLIVDLTTPKTDLLHQRISQANDCISSIRESAQKYANQMHRLSVMIIRHSNIRCYYHDVAIVDAQDLSMPTMTDAPEDGKVLDAIGTSIAIWRALGRQRGRSDRHQVTLFWSGADHGSKKYDRCSLKKLIGSLVGIGWQFTLVGSGKGLGLIAGQLGISKYYRSSPQGSSHERRVVISRLKRQWVQQQVNLSTKRVGAPSIAC